MPGSTNYLLSAQQEGREAGRRQAASLGGSGQALYVLASSLDLTLEPRDLLNKGFKRGVTGSDFTAQGGSGHSLEGTRERTPQSLQSEVTVVIQ